MTDREQPSVEVTQAGAATEAATLEQHVMDPNIPKNEAGWWARSQIEDLRAQLAESEARVRVLREAFNAAKAFIDSHVADPDITAEMCARWAEYNTALDTLKEHPNEQA